jgi:predicted nucleic acid-binding protein
MADVPSARDSRHCRTADDRGIACSPCPSRHGSSYAFASQGCSGGERRALIVVDAPGLIEVLLNTSAAGRLAERLFAECETLHAPHLIDVEVGQVLRRYPLSGDVRAQRGVGVLEDLVDFPITRYPHTPLLSRIWDLRHNVTAYDAAYLVSAEAPVAPLVARDAELASSAGHQARIELIA